MGGVLMAADGKVLDLAYQIAVSSYDWAAKRFDAIDARIQTVLGVGLSVTLAIPVGISALKLSADSRWIGGAVLLFILAIAVGTHARLLGELTLVTPKVLYDKWLGLSEEDFKRNLVYFAGQHMEMNRDLIARKHRLLAIVTVIFLMEFAAAVLGVILPLVHP
jgi:hypothetical protein